MQILTLKKHPLIIKKPPFETKEANNYAEEAKDSIAKFKHKAEQANTILKNHNKVRKKPKLLDFFVRIGTLPGLQNNQLETEPLTILR
jgi:hypothetical protein